MPMAIVWSVENVRLTLFSGSPLQISEADWRAVTGREEAEARQAVPGGRMFTGPFEGGQLSVSGAFQRADLIFAAALPNEVSAEPQLLNVGTWEAVRDRFSAFASSWMESISFPIVRMAFGAVLLCRAENKMASYELLKQLLSSVTVDPVRMSDLVFRVNWPTTSKTIEGLRLNRITNWSAIQVMLANVTLGPHANQALLSEGLHAVRLEIDHSSDQARVKEFPRAALKPIYDELVLLSSENSSEGEIQ
jgi:hypothetical protein